MTAVIHIAGLDVTIGQFYRQRCAWCGAVLMDGDVTRIAVPEGQSLDPPKWPVRELVARDGYASYTVEYKDGQPLPDGACGKLDPAVTA